MKDHVQMTELKCTGLRIKFPPWTSLHSCETGDANRNVSCVIDSRFCVISRFQSNIVKVAIEKCDFSLFISKYMYCRCLWPFILPKMSGLQGKFFSVFVLTIQLLGHMEGFMHMFVMSFFRGKIPVKLLVSFEVQTGWKKKEVQRAVRVCRCPNGRG